MYEDSGLPPARDRRRRRVLWIALAALLVGYVAIVWVPPVVTDWYWQATAPPSCGSIGISLNGGHQLSGGAAGAELCFVRAVRTCTPRSLDYGESGTDFGDDQDLRVVRSASGCHVADRASGFVNVRRAPTVELDCSGVRWDGSGWVIACGSSTTVKLWWPTTSVSGPVRPVPEPSS